MIWFSADWHLQHQRIIEYANRPFIDTTEMDNCIFDAVNHYVKPEDTLWFLGDLSMQKSTQSYREIRSRIRCNNVKVVIGNHDTITNIRKANFQFVGIDYDVVIEKQLLHLYHYPLIEWNRYFQKSWHLYGHCHGSREKQLDTLFPGRLSMDVGIDNIARITGEYRPISFSEIKERFEQ